MNLESDKRLNIQLRLDFSSAPKGEARQAGGEDIESLLAANEPERPADTRRIIGSKRVSVTSRTAVYGPVRTVVWEGRSREAPPYPDRCPLSRRSIAIPTRRKSAISEVASPFSITSSTRASSVGGMVRSIALAVLPKRGNCWDMVLLPHRAHPVTSNRDTIRTAISVASNATNRRDPIHKTDHA